MTLDTIISSTNLLLTSTYFLNLRNQIKKFESEKDIQTLDFQNCYFLNYQQIYEVPKLEEIENFQLHEYLKNNESTKTRSYDFSSIKDMIMVLDKKDLSNEDILTDLVSSYKYFPNDYFLLVYPEYYKYFKDVFNYIFNQDNTLTSNNKYLVAIIVSFDIILY